ncbi:S9 family peptidase [bacterium]|nr:MAG: S9 family peptidase [bacterium]
MLVMIKKAAFLLAVILLPNLIQAQSFDFEALFDGRYRQESVEAPNWMNNGKFYSALKFSEENNTVELRKYSITDDSFEVLVSEKELATLNNDLPIEIEDYQFSADETKLLIQTKVEAVWRRSRLANFYVYDLKAKSLQALTANDIKIGNAEFSPKGDKVAFTRENDLFLVDLKSGKESAITTDGKINSIINGSTDWVYEEEFSFAKAWFWSPDGNRIAFYRFDESKVREFFYTLWGPSNYPDKVTYKYPKAGEQNAVVTIGVYDLDTKVTKWVKADENPDHYIVRVNWTNSSNRLALRKMNRLQNVQELLVYSFDSEQIEIIKKEENPQWIEENDALYFLSDGKSFIYMSEEDGFNHLYIYTDNGKKMKQITKGAWDVIEVIGINEKRKEIYYISAEDSPLERQLYSIRFDGKKKTKLTKEAGTHAIEMSGDQQYYLDYFSSVNQPLRVTLHDSKGKQIRLLEDNNVLSGILTDEPLPTKSFITIPNETGLNLNASVIKPYDFDESKKYPVLMYVYGGPGSQTVTNEFETDQRSLWHYYLASKGYIVVSVDNRGTGARGAEFKKAIYKNLGKVEIEDQLAAANYLKSLPYVDADRVGIWGWSYGGFMSSLALTRGSDVFKAAIAVSPVIDWRYYDTIYTERYMQTPQLNAEGYRNASPIFEAAKLKGHYLLVHGTGDDNVHFQNSVTMADALQYYNIPFETMFYPNRNHGIYGGNTRRHLYSMLTEFILENL